MVKGVRAFKNWLKKNNPERYQTIQKTAKRKYRNDYWDKYPEKRKAARKRHNNKSRYGFTEEEYQAFLDSRGRKCEVCGDDRKPCVDHCHKTDIVRGVLCGGCNTSLGQLKEDPKIIRALADYIERTKDGCEK